MTGAGLAALVAALEYKPGWRFRLDYGVTSAASSCWAWGLPDGLGGAAVPAAVTVGWPARLVVCLRTRDSLPPHGTVLVEHSFAVPDEPPAGVSWHRWLLDCILRVEIHEACEAFAVGGRRPFYPRHGPGADLYAITDRGLPGCLEP